MNLTELGNRIRARRLALDLTIKEASDRSGVSVPVWDVVENARRENISPRTWRKIEQVLGWPPHGVDNLIEGNEIYEEDPEEPKSSDRPENISLLISAFSPNHQEVIAALVADMAAATLRSQSWQLQLVDDLYKSANIEAFYESITRDFVHTSLMMGELEDFELFIRSIIEDEESKYEDLTSRVRDLSDHDNIPMAADEDDRTGDNVRRIRPSPESSDDFPG